MKKISIILIIWFTIITSCFSQETYKIDKTEYYYNLTYSTTGKPMVKRSEKNRSDFLKSKGYDNVPKGYEVDHIKPLSEGGSDDPSNMQLLTKEEHAKKTAKERAKNSNSTYNNNNYYNSTSTYNKANYQYSTPSTTNNNSYQKTERTIYTGSRGGKYYINSNGNKTYIKKNK